MREHRGAHEGEKCKPSSHATRRNHQAGPQPESHNFVAHTGLHHVATSQLIHVMRVLTSANHALPCGVLDGSCDGSAGRFLRPATAQAQAGAGRAEAAAAGVRALGPRERRRRQHSAHEGWRPRHAPAPGTCRGQRALRPRFRRGSGHVISRGKAAAALPESCVSRFCAAGAS